METSQKEKLNFETISYPDLLGYLGVDNTPPGGNFTLDYWIEKSEINRRSHLLDLACSTGFSGRNIVLKTGCRGKGVDISKASIEAANNLSIENGIGKNIQFSIGNAEELSFEDRFFSHVTAGCCFGFIADKQTALKETYRVLKDDGYLCISPFFYEAKPDDELLSLIKEHIGYRPDPQRNYDYWKSFFSQYFTLESEELFNLPVYSDSEIEKIVNATITAKSAFRSLNQKDRQYIFDRYYNTRIVLNEHAKFQSVALWVMRVKK
jgi:ubiquinone/menaquinone biosynthesis C-methylase UbiE